MNKAGFTTHTLVPGLYLLDKYEFTRRHKLTPLSSAEQGRCVWLVVLLSVAVYDIVQRYVRVAVAGVRVTFGAEKPLIRRFE